MLYENTLRFRQHVAYKGLVCVAAATLAGAFTNALDSVLAGVLGSVDAKICISSVSSVAVNGILDLTTDAIKVSPPLWFE